MSGAAARVVVVDDQRVVREGLVSLLSLLPDVAVVGTAADGDEAVDVVARERPDVVLMDLRMPRCDGVEATRRVLEAAPDTRVVVLTTYADDVSVFSALQAGARGYLTKDSGAEEIARAIAAVHAGEALLDPSVQRRLLDAMASHGDTAAPPQVPAGNPDGLTSRETDVLLLVAEGLDNREIATRLFISEATVKSHINSIFSKTQVRDRAQAVAYAYRLGLVR
ncbi:MAG TPA: response regulator transcription factor [Candidatus Dormibacteraeota bacterium]|nr:response regulator transcription factor [Candidatus Dormibacteraeota bacterium]